MLKITVIYGQSHKGSTYNISKLFLDKITDAEKIVDEYFMPDDTPDFCLGCYKCFDLGEDQCPQAEKVERIVKSMVDSDIIIITSPTYCYNMTGQLKTFLDHLGYMWLSHRPKEEMFNKLGLVISTAAGAGSGKVTKSLEQQMFWLGIPKVYRYNKSVNAASWEAVPDKIKNPIKKDISKLAGKVRANIGKARPGIKLKFMFNIMRMAQKSNDWNMTDRNHWEEKGWLEKDRPWLSKQVKTSN